MDRTSEPGLLGRVIREPLLHFLLIGVVVFALYPAGSPTGSAGAQRVIEVTPEQVERLAGQFEAVWRRPPSGADLDGLVEDFVREEVYYREALALGLDRDDTVIRRRLRQKMEFLSDAAARPPGDTELRTHFADHTDRFTPVTRVTFRQVFLGGADPAPVLAALARGTDPDEIGHGTLLPPGMEAAAETSVDGTFGDGFFAAVSALEQGPWRGPVDSAFGAHLVQLVEVAPAVPPSFDAVRAAVEEDWRRQTAAELREAQYRALLERYHVIMPPAAER